MNEPRLTAWDNLVAGYDLDQLFGVPRALRLRTMHMLGLFLGAVSIGAALQWPRAWQLVGLADLAAMSLLFALAAGREWFLRYRPGQRLLAAHFVNVARPRLEYGTVAPST